MNAGDRIMGLDYGSKRIGVAISDPLRLSAQPCPTIEYQNEKELWRKFEKIQREMSIETIVLGLPLNMNGSEGETARAVHAFADQLRQRYSFPIAFWDERLSTRVAERTIRELGGQPSRRREHVDQVAAVWILQGFLDRLAGSGSRMP